MQVTPVTFDTTARSLSSASFTLQPVCDETSGGSSMKATPPARVLVALVNGLDRYWGLVGVAVVVLLEAFVFAPRGQTTAMIVGGIVGAALLVGWLVGEA